MPILVVSSSLNPQSRSRTLAREIHRLLSAAGSEVETTDLATLDLPLCDGEAAYSHPAVAPLAARIAAADAVVLAFPVYNYASGAACKNLIELTGKAWENKIVGMVCAAGGASSYMAPMSLAASLMLDFRCLVLPRYVYATDAAVSEAAVTDADVARRLEALAAEVIRVSRALVVRT